MKSRLYLCCAFAAVLLAGMTLGRMTLPQTASAASISPATGWNVHVDAIKHFGDANPNEVAHHWCKNVAGGLLECQIYDADAADAHLVAVETIVPTATWKTFSPQEQALWHYHRDEIPKVDVKTPDMAPADAQKLAASLMETYGKVYVLWDPMATKNMPLGQPTVTILH